MPTCKWCPATGSDVVPTLMYRLLPLCPPCRGIHIDMPLTEEAIARRYEQGIRLHGRLPEVVNLDDPCP